MIKNHLRTVFPGNIPGGNALFPLVMTVMVFLHASCGNGAGESPEELFTAAGDAFRSGDLEAASSLLVRVTELDPGNPNVWYNLGTVRMSQGLFPEAIDAYQTVISLDSTRVDALTGLTGALTGAGRLEEALDAGSLAVRCNPQDGTAFNNYGMALMETGDLAGAASCFSSALRRSPDNPSVRYNCGRMSMIAGDYQDALSFFISVTEAEPGHYGARLEAARAYGMMGMHQEAEQAAIALLATSPGDVDAQEILALSLSGQGEYPEALEVLHDILEVHPGHMRSILGVAECLYQMEDTTGALDQYLYFISLLDDTSGTGAVRMRISELEASIE